MSILPAQPHGLNLASATSPSGAQDCPCLQHPRGSRGHTAPQPPAPPAEGFATPVTLRHLQHCSPSSSRCVFCSFRSCPRSSHHEKLPPGEICFLLTPQAIPNPRASHDISKHPCISYSWPPPPPLASGPLLVPVWSHHSPRLAHWVCSPKQGPCIIVPASVSLL